MTRTIPALIVAAHLHHSQSGAAKKQNEHMPISSPQLSMDSPNFRRTNRLSAFDSPKSGREPHMGSITQSRKTRKLIRTPLALLDRENGGCCNTPTPAQRANATPSSSRETMRSVLRGIAYTSSIELANDSTEKVKTRAMKLESRIEELETLASEFKRKVRGITKEFRGLKEDVDDLSLEFETLENDHTAALACLDEERSTSMDYLGKLRNAEVEIELLYQSLPEGLGDDSQLGGFSQANSSKARYDRYA